MARTKSFRARETFDPAAHATAVAVLQQRSVNSVRRLASRDDDVLKALVALLHHMRRCYMHGDTLGTLRKLELVLTAMKPCEGMNTALNSCKARYAHTLWKPQAARLAESLAAAQAAGFSLVLRPPADSQRAETVLPVGGASQLAAAVRAAM